LCPPQLFFGSGDGDIYALDAEDGTKKGWVGTGGFIVSSPALAPDAPVLYIGSLDMAIYAVELDESA
jgi:outer membrane protein assembly factor BamB